MTNKLSTQTYKGVTINHDVFGKWRTPSLHWGENPAEHFSFNTLKSAKAFIDRRIKDNELNKLRRGKW